MGIRKTVDLTFSFAVMGVPESQEQKYSYHGVSVTIDEKESGGTQQLYVTLHEELEGLPEINHAWLTYDGKTLEGIAKFTRENVVTISLYRDQGING
ncbi:hypothetical protein [Pseudomonas luteola]|uniref:hypothetical protein n=1 Tax=Pseudomonas luteola TaxID=47886 RepID=UPI0015E3FA77|nr:hypothetical protein [Pseudomonas zeshuii]MBA1250933.1 hypothetical protein [Pseudomonas zeshuii]